MKCFVLSKNQSYNGATLKSVQMICKLSVLSVKYPGGLQSVKIRLERYIENIASLD